MGFNDELTQALRERQFDNRDPGGNALKAVWNRKTLPVCAGDQKAMKSLGIGGFGSDANCILIIVLTDLVTGFKKATDLVGKIPLPQQTIVHQGITYRISDTTMPPGLAFLVLALVDPSKGV